MLTLDAEKSVIPDNCLKELKGNGKHIEQFIKLKRLYSCLSRLKTYKNLKKKCYHLSHRGVVVVRHITGHQLLEEMINRSVSQT